MMRRFLVLLWATALLRCATGTEVAQVPDQEGGTNPAPDSGVCMSMCGGQCAELKTDPANCGKCGTACPMGATCVQGTCQCGMGQTRCGNTCVDTKSDLANCGKCGTVCGGGDGGAIMGG